MADNLTYPHHFHPKHPRTPKRTHPRNNWVALASFLSTLLGSLSASHAVVIGSAFDNGDGTFTSSFGPGSLDFYEFDTRTGNSTTGSTIGPASTLAVSVPNSNSWYICLVLPGLILAKQAMRKVNRRIPH